MPKKILLADDSITIQKVVELTFSDGDYEVIATNNGAKAILKLADVRPDIILSDIIMPEKNGYEVCEFVKSHPDYRDIPVILLTGTFEPFDPDRAEKAGCDAVVTKPFESQGLIQKVEELIAQAELSRATSAPPPPPAPEPPQNIGTAATTAWPISALGAVQPPEPPMPAEDTPFGGEESSPFADAAPAPEPPPSYQAHDDSIFTRPVEALVPPPLPIEQAPMSGGATRAFPAMSFSDLQGMEPEPAPAVPSWSPKDEPAPGATLAFPKLSMEDLERMNAEPLTTPAAPPFEPEAPTATSAPWSPKTPAFEAPGGATAFEEESPFATPPAELPPTMEQSMSSAESWPPTAGTIREPEAAAEPAFEPPPALPWEEPAEPAAAEQSVWADKAPAAEPTPAWQAPAEPAAREAPPKEAPSWQEPAEIAPARDQAPPAESASAWEEAPEVAPPPPWEPPAEEVPSWNPPAEESAAASSREKEEAPASQETSSFGDSAEASGPWEESEPEPAPSPFLQPAEEPAPSPFMQPEPEVAAAPSWEEPASAEPAPVPSWEEPAAAVVAPAFAPMAEAPSTAAASFGEMTDEQVDRIARRVVQLLSTDVVKNIAWEVIPDLAESLVRERIRQLETEA